MRILAPAAAAAGHKGVVRDLFARRPDVNARDKTGATPLHLAAAGGHAEVVGLLLTKGADVNAKDKEGRTARDAAKSPEIAAVLRRATGRTDPPQTPKTPVRPGPGPDTQPSVPKERPKQEPPREPKTPELPTVSGKVTVHLKDGKNATGQVFKSRPESVTLQVSGMALRTYKADQVKRIEQGGRVVFDADSVADNNK